MNTATEQLENRMTDAVAEVPEEPAKSKKKSLIIGLVLALAGAGGGYFATASGMLPFGAGTAHGAEETAPGEGVATQEHVMAPAPLPDIAFVALEPIVISLNHAINAQYLRFRAQLEVDAAHKAEVETLIPRVMDVMNSYLRALEVKDFTDPIALTRLRAQLLRRIQIVTGTGRVRDLLIMDFVLN